MGEIGVVMVRMRPSSELPEHVNPKYAVTSTTLIPLDVEACSRACALTCGCHSDSVSSTRAAWSRSCGAASFPAR
ncbi:hypothetical protein ADL02_03425 [Streptomyces sp. NRRL WC-3723]|nr:MULTISPECIES: hypothetical protein [unclassified Streptomyces]KOX00433.1 hypothetical protein ADL02_03425 [Streptomyces sp. NRRL WC-3723]